MRALHEQPHARAHPAVPATTTTGAWRSSRAAAKRPSRRGNVAYRSPDAQVEGIGVERVHRLECGFRHLGEVAAPERVADRKRIAAAEHRNRLPGGMRTRR